MTFDPITNGESGVSVRGKLNGLGTNFDTHESLSGSDVHALGDISVQSASAVSISGSLTELTSHESLSGSDVHALGDISVQSASVVAITGGSLVSNYARFGNNEGSTYFEEEGSLVASGSATTWEDLRFPATAINPLGAASPMGFNTTLLGFTAAADSTQVIGIIAQLPHSWKLGSTIYPHVHWMPANTDTGNVLWRISYKWTDIGGVEAGTFADLDVVQAGAGVAYTHQLVGWTISGSAISNISSILSIFVSRIGGDENDTYNAEVLLKEFDIHYEVDTLGSRLPLSK